MKIFSCTKGGIDPLDTSNTTLEKELPNNINLWGDQFQEKLQEINFKDLMTARRLEGVTTNISGLTDNQFEVLGLLSYSLKKSISFDEFKKNIIKTNRLIRKNIPKSEQESWFYLTAYFYYGMEYIHDNTTKIRDEVKDIDLENKNLSLRTYNYFGNSDIYKPCIESDDPTLCMDLSETLFYMYFIAILEPTFFGEAIAIVVTIYYGSIVFNELVDLIMERSECIDIYANECRPNGVRDHCANCLWICINEGDWPYKRCK